jgi:hypothetical protein
VSLRIPSSSRSPDHDPHRTIYYLGYPLGRFAGLKHRHGRTLEPPSRDSTGSNHDVRPARAPSPSLSILCGHPRPCCATPHTTTTTPTLLSTQGRDAATLATAPRTDRCQRLPRARLKTPRSTTTPPTSKSPLFKHRTRHGAVTRAILARTAVNSTALYAMPPHVAK